MSRTMGVWEKHALRLRRQAELERFGAWLQEHPRAALAIAVTLALGVLALAALLRFALDELARRLL